jgi:hypothetical protein
MIRCGVGAKIFVGFNSLGASAPSNRCLLIA